MIKAALIAFMTLTDSATEVTPVHKSPSAPQDTGNRLERRVILLLVSVLAVFLFWVVLTAYLIPASKQANIKLRILEQEQSLSEFDKLVMLHQLDKKKPKLES